MMGFLFHVLQHNFIKCLLLGAFTYALMGCGATECDHVEPCFSYNASGCYGTIRVVTEDGELSPNDATFYATGDSAPDVGNTEAWVQCSGSEGCMITASCTEDSGTVHIWSEGYEVASVPYAIVKDADTTTNGCTIEGCLRVDDFESDVTLQPASM